jgi:hypothetical protein
LEEPMSMMESHLHTKGDMHIAGIMEIILPMMQRPDHGIRRLRIPIEK